jgi:hypothetical protein
MTVIADVVFPILFIVALGFIFRRLGGRFEHAFSRTQLYILVPALLFTVVSGSEASLPTIGTVLLYVAILTAVLIGITQGIGLLARSSRAERNAISLAGVFTNSGFYGIPVCMLAFGDRGLIWASVYVIASSTIQSTVGIYVASAGHRRAVDALAAVFKVPLIWALVAGKGLAALHALPPEPLMRMLDLMGKSAIPLGLLLLGMQLERIVSGETAREEAAVRECDPDAGHPRREVALGVAAGMIKVFGGLGAALVILPFFDLDPVLRNVILVQSAMPTAVNAVVYATEFECRPQLVATGILSSTLISVASIALILRYLT